MAAAVPGPHYSGHSSALQGAPASPVGACLQRHEAARGAQEEALAAEQRPPV